MARLGLTGGIGSGKSTVAGLLSRLGAELIDSDAISRSLTAPGGAALPAVRAAFGDAVFAADGTLDRAALRQRVFTDPSQRQRLEAVLHPLIAQECDRQAQASSHLPVVFDVPLLAESRHWRDRVDRVLVIDCSEATQCERVQARSGWDEATVRRVIAQQATRAARRAAADAVIVNEQLSMAELADAVDAVWRWFTLQVRPLLRG